MAIEGGKKTATGDLFNEVPDRIADVLILVAMGFVVQSQPVGIHLGWLVATLAVMTAYTRLLGAALTGQHDFRGPMAKSQRMALATGLCLVVAVLPDRVDWMFWGLTLMVVGAGITVVRRLYGIAVILRSK